MYTFTVKTMSCGGCAAAITRAIKAADETAQVRALPAEHRLDVISRLSSEHLMRLLDEAGYTAEPRMEA